MGRARNPRVLLVEDNPGDARLLREALREADRETDLVHADRFSAAAAAFEQTRPDAVLLDLSLPDTAGIETVERAVGRFTDTPVIVLTGTDDETTALASLEMGAQDYLYKGDVTPRALRRALRYALERNRLTGGYRFLDRLSTALMHPLGPDEVATTFTECCVPSIADGCAVFRPVPGDDPRIAAVRSVSGCGTMPDPDEVRAVHDGLRAAELCCAQNAEDDCGSPRAAGAAGSLEIVIRDGLVIPMMGRDGPVGVVLYRYHGSPGGRRVTDPLLAREATARFALALENALLLGREQSARAEAERAVQLREEVQGIVAHDLRNPLASMKMAAEVILESEIDEVRQQELLWSIVRNSEYIDRLISDLLDVARIEGGALGIDPIPVSPSGLIELAREALADQADVADVRLVCEIDGTTQAVMADPDRIRQALVNLGGNAVKFASAGDTVVLGARAAGDGVELSVSDDGPGIPGDEIPHLFDRFWKSGRFRTEGAGLGLTIARGIVEGHGARLSVESVPGVRTRFRFTLPRLREGSTSPGLRREPLPLANPF